MRLSTARWTRVPKSPAVLVSAGSAPVDFYRADAAAAYGKLYQCQFFTGKTAEQSRNAMIAASASFILTS